MSSTEPPSRNAPRNQPHETKAARDEMSSKGKVEKIHEIDADEQARKRRFLKYYKEDALSDEKVKEENRPSPFDLYSSKEESADRGGKGNVGSSSETESDFNGEGAASPFFSPAPLDPFQGSQNEENGSIEEALPQSGSFWEEVGLPDDPLGKPRLEPTEGRGTPVSFEKGKENNGEKNSAGITKNPKGAASSLSSSNRPGLQKGKDPKNFPIDSSLQKQGEKESGSDKGKKIGPSPFGLPGKGTSPSPFSPNPAKGKKEGPLFSSPLDENQKGEPLFSDKRKQKLPEEEAPPSFPFIQKEGREKKQRGTEEEDVAVSKQESPFYFDQREQDPKGSKDQKKEGEKGGQLEYHSLPPLPSGVEPMAMNGAMQASPSLNPTAVALFFQMVGTMFSMGGTEGIARTEIVLNHPSYANSRFYGSTITIEKYATAPDSFNIRLTGSEDAVASFQENIPSLMSAFQNGNFSFKVNRLDVEYSSARPVFRRKEKGEGRGESESGDLGERRES